MFFFLLDPLQTSSADDLRKNTLIRQWWYHCNVFLFKNACKKKIWNFQSILKILSIKMCMWLKLKWFFFCANIYLILALGHQISWTYFSHIYLFWHNFLNNFYFDVICNTYSITIQIAFSIISVHFLIIGGVK
jgi:hypothetical protein